MIAGRGASADLGLPCPAVSRASSLNLILSSSPRVYADKTTFHGARASERPFDNSRFNQTEFLGLTTSTTTRAAEPRLGSEPRLGTFTTSTNLTDALADRTSAVLKLTGQLATSITLCDSSSAAPHPGVDHLPGCGAGQTSSSSSILFALTEALTQTEFVGPYAALLTPPPPSAPPTAASPLTHLPGDGGAEHPVST